MKIGMMNDPARDLYSEIIFAGESGFDFIDLTIEPPCAQVCDISVSRVVKLLTKYKLGIVGHTNFYLPWASPIKRLKNAAIKELTDHLEVFNRLEVDRVTIHPHWYQPNSSDIEIVGRNIASLREIIELANEKNIKIMLEHQPNGMFKTPQSLKVLFDSLSRLYFHLDVGHALVAGNGRNLMSDFLSNYKNKLMHIHFSDNKGKHDDHLSIGTGIVNWNGVVRRIKGIGYDGTITLEVFVEGEDRDGLVQSKKKIQELWNN